MTDLPVPEPVRAPPLTDDDVRAALMPIVPGWYRSADLLPRFNAWCREQGRDPVTAKTLGQAISAHFTATKRYATGHVAVWFLDEATLTHRNWFKARRD